MVEATNDRPSSARRRSLREADQGSTPEVSSFFPLETYFNASEKLVAAFEHAVTNKELDNAFVYGWRYSTFCVEQLPKHDYYKLAKYASVRKKTTRNLTSVITQLEHIADLMDAEEIEKERIRKQKEAEAEAKRTAELLARFEAYQMPTNATSSSSSRPSAATVEQSAFAKLAALQGGNRPVSTLRPVPPPPDTPTDLSQLQPVQPPIVEDVSSDEDDDDDDHEHGGDDGSQMPPPPPSYNQASALRQSSYFGPGARERDDDKPKKSVSFSATNQVKLIPPNNKKHRESGPPSYHQVTGSTNGTSSGKKVKRKKKRRMSIRQIKDHATRQYEEFQRSKKIEVSRLGTYQGRANGSTNGCTVISALCASRHLETSTGLTTPLANQVIDQACVPLLRKIRAKLHLSAGSLIIPSDVHDHLVDSKLLFQHKFVGATGGNILDPDHLETVVSYLHNGCDTSVGGAEMEAKKNALMGRKAAATLFFKEHVISIVKFPTSPTTAVYDLIDSMPRGGTGVGSRTRCHGTDALRVLLQWYACSKFSTSNLKYLETHPWEESMADFDPRVFQAFVWSDQPMPKQ